MKAKPLSSEDIRDFVQEGWGSLLRVFEGRLYDSQDLYSCDYCGEVSDMSEPFSWNDGLCDGCWEDYEADNRHDQQLRADYYGNVL